MIFIYIVSLFFGIVSIFMVRDWILNDKYGYECWNCKKRKGEQYIGSYVYECKECKDKRKISFRYCPVCREQTYLHWNVCQKCGVMSKKGDKI